MKRLIATLVAFLALTSFAFAQVPMTGAGLPKPATGGGGYTGPGDIVANPVAYYAPYRCVATAFSGSIADIVDSATGNTTGTRLQCSSGGVISAVVSASACTFVTGNACSALATTCAVACKIVTLYDQGSAGVNITQATNASRPSFITGGAPNGTVAIARFAGSQLLTGTISVQKLVPLSILNTAKYTGSTQDASFASNTGVSGFQLGYNLTASNANTAFIYGGGASVSQGTASDNTWHNMTGIINGASSILYVDGSSAASGVNIGTGDWKTSAYMGSSDASNNKFHGDIGEIGIWSGTTSSGNASSLSTNSKSYFGY